MHCVTNVFLIFTEFNVINVVTKGNIINNQRRDKQLVILKQDKGIGIVLLDKTSYVEKCFSIINTNKFKKLDKNPIVSYEAKIQGTLRKMKSQFTLQ